MTVDSSTVTTWPSDAAALRSLLGITPSPGMHCHGTTKKRQGCRAPISRESASSIDVLLLEIAKKGSVVLAGGLLVRLAGLVVCKRFHQSFAEGLLGRWRTVLDELKGEEDGGKSTKEEHEERVEAVSEDEDTKIQNYGDDETVQSTAVKTESDKIKTETSDEPQHPSSLLLALKPSSPAQSDINIKDIPPHPSKSPTRTQIQPAPVDKHTFTPFGESKTTAQLNRSVKDLIARTLLPSTELPTTTEKGFIYVYTFPTRYRLRTPHLKIGHAKNVTQRMADWRRKCGYEPSLLSSFSAELYVKIERLVHAQLWNQRRREACCPTCRGAHVEWFEVKETTASGLISLWSHWSRLEPYDEAGVLKTEWRDKLDRVDLGDPECWNDFVYGKSAV